MQGALLLPTLSIQSLAEAQVCLRQPTSSRKPCRLIIRSTDLCRLDLETNPDVSDPIARADSSVTNPESRKARSSVNGHNCGEAGNVYVVVWAARFVPMSVDFQSYVVALNVNPAFFSTKLFLFCTYIVQSSEK